MRLPSSLLPERGTGPNLSSRSARTLGLPGGEKAHGAELVCPSVLPGPPCSTDRPSALLSPDLECQNPPCRLPPLSCECRLRASAESLRQTRVQQLGAEATAGPVQSCIPPTPCPLSRQLCVRYVSDVCVVLGIRRMTKSLPSRKCGVVGTR